MWSSNESCLLPSLFNPLILSMLQAQLVYSTSVQLLYRGRKVCLELSVSDQSWMLWPIQPTEELLGSLEQDSLTVPLTGHNGRRQLARI